MAAKESKAMVAFKERAALAAAQQRQAAPAASGLPRFSTRGGVLEFQGTKIKGHVNIVVLGFVYENVWYDPIHGDFDPEVLQLPDCAATGKLDMPQVDLVSSEHSPNRQNDECRTCWANQFKSADKGNGKACQNRVKCLVIAADKLTDDGIRSATIGVLSIPPTALKPFREYTKFVINGMEFPTRYVVTKLYMEFPSADSQQAVPHLEYIAEIPFEIVDAVDAVLEENTEELEMPIDFSQASAEKPKVATKKKVAKKKVAKKKVAKKAARRR